MTLVLKNKEHGEESAWQFPKGPEILTVYFFTFFETVFFALKC